MMRVIDRSGRERLEQNGYILQDGESYRVPMMFMDDKAPPPDDPTKFTDAQAKRINDAYNTYLTNLTTAWQRKDEPVPPSNQQQRQPQPPPSSHSDSTLDARDQAYRRYVERISNAWRGAP